MKKLEDYVKGYPGVAILLIASVDYKDEHYYLVKEENYDSFYFMKGQEVLDRKYIPNDKFYSLHLAQLNNKMNKDKLNEINSQIKDCVSYKAFCRFIKDQTKGEYKYE